MLKMRSIHRNYKYCEQTCRGGGEGGVQAGVRILVDGEHSWLQAAIDLAAERLQRSYNRGGVPVVYNTFQCYRHDTHHRCRTLPDRSTMSPATQSQHQMTEQPNFGVCRTGAFSEFVLCSAQVVVPEL